ncbi:MAG: hypothetical protein Q8876_01005 [Bacillota bacterium]|nr:hypothetical protein [Bacillota bacterium]
MIYIILEIILIFFAAFGITELIRMLLFSGLKCKEENSMILLVPIYKECDDVEILLRNAAMRVKWLDNNHIGKIICLDLGMNEENRKICETFCNDYHFIEIATTENLNQEINL